MRTFFLRDKILTSCGTREGSGGGGIAYFCPACGEIWGRVTLGWMDWMAANILCGTCPRGNPSYPSISRGCPGSFLKPLGWWDRFNGNSLPERLNLADSTLLRYEAERHIEWILPKDA